MNTISICQPHFIPWIGYFKMIKDSSKIIFLDNVQYNRRSWQNRTHIRNNSTDDKIKFLSLAVIDNTRSKKINQIFISNENIKNFRNQLLNTYSSTRNFKKYFDFLVNILENNINQNLAHINIVYIKEICKILEIDINFEISSKYNFKSKKEFLILDILKAEKAKIYFSNLGSKKYVNEEFFEKNNIKVVYNDFIHPLYEQYSKKKLNFIKKLSIVDLLFNHDYPRKML